jgi:hypothetical protein
MIDRFLHTRHVFVIVAMLCGASDAALAYRPFDSTDASAAGRGEIEIECGPFGYIVEAGERLFVVPSAILNIGLVDGWEIVLEGRNFVRANPGEGDRRDTLKDTALSVKHVFRQGTLQEGVGPSLAFESGLLLPTIGAERGVGTSLAGILSQRWSAVTLHVNGALVVSHDHTVGGSAGAILEGPSRWKVRPVAEVNVEDQDGRAAAGLVGAIWQVRDGLSLDVGGRLERSGGATVREIRAGFTWGFPVRPRGGNSPHDASAADRWRRRAL